MRPERWLPLTAGLAAMALGCPSSTPSRAQAALPMRTVTRPIEERTVTRPIEDKSSGVPPAHAAALDAARLAEMIHDAPAGDPHRAVVARLRAEVNRACVQCHAGGVSVREDDLLGLAVVPADEALRAQLKLDGRGLVVTAVARGSEGDLGGIKANDVLIASGGKPLVTVSDLGLVIKKMRPTPGEAARPGTPGRHALSLRIIRDGEPREVQIPAPGMPAIVVGRLDPEIEGRAKAPGYWIGVAVGEADATLRAHLKLDEGIGLVVTDVVKDSPATKAGLKKNDVLASIDGTPLKSPEDLIRVVRTSRGEKPLAIKLRRAGEEIITEVRPEARKEPEAVGSISHSYNPPMSSWVVDFMPFIRTNGAGVNWAAPTQPYWNFVAPNNHVDPFFLFYPTQRVDADHREAEGTSQGESGRDRAPDRIDARLKAIEGQVKEIKSAVDELKEALKRDKGR